MPYRDGTIFIAKFAGSGERRTNGPKCGNRLIPRARVVVR